MQTPGGQPRVAFLGYAHNARGGIAQFGRELAEAVEDRAEVLLVGFRKLYPGFTTPGRQGPDPSARRTTVDAVAIPVPWLPWTWRQTSRRLAAFRPDLLVVQWWTPLCAPCVRAVVRRVKRDGARTLIVCHNHLPHERFPFSRALSRAALGQADTLAAFSPAVADGIRDLVPGATVAIPAPLPPLLEVPQAAAGDWPRRLALDGGPVILFFGTVRAYKGLEDLIAALPRVRRHVDATLVVAGTFFEPLERYERLARDADVEDHVRFVPEYVPDEDVPGLLATSDVLALPHRTASQSGLVGLAAGARKPVVATAVGALPAMLGANGIIVEPSDPPALADGLVRALSDPPAPPELRADAWDRWRDFVLVNAGTAP